MTVYCGPMHAGQIVEVFLIVAACVLAGFALGRWFR
jgi:hypothetical protein